MKKIFAIALLGVATAASAKLVPNVPAVDFGHLVESEGAKMQRVEVTNDGSEPLTIMRVRPTCGCTAADYFQDEIAPGATGWIDVTYNPEGRIGVFEKGIKIYSSDGEMTLLPVKGVIEASEETVARRFPYHAAPFWMSEQRVVSPRLTPDKAKPLMISVYNSASHDVQPLVENPNPEFEVLVVPEVLPAWNMGTLAVSIKPKAFEAHGKSTYSFKVIPDPSDPSCQPVTVEVILDTE